MRLFDDMSFNSQAIEKTLINLQHEYYEEKRAPYRSYNQLQKLDNAYEEYFRQMQNARQEKSYKTAQGNAEMVHKFYTGLPNQKVVTQKEIEDEQCQIEKVYDLFKRYYNWSGKKIFTIFHSYCPSQQRLLFFTLAENKSEISLPLSSRLAEKQILTCKQLALNMESRSKWNNFNLSLCIL
ncbi:hypothetical protein Anas_09768 [Armadillidium nasatum]|uniref:Uncharacterized protein n=1 Tax=Armadillidium nasatum TaxID=96803 RepID=A0A5N5T6H4_9CRUS|nr:hypothetical protein Anas_09768 [Armadillidium nasatum]